MLVKGNMHLQSIGQKMQLKSSHGVPRWLTCQCDAMPQATTTSLQSKTSIHSRLDNFRIFTLTKITLE